jgi:PAS domain S-box-containing protein
MRTFFDFAPFLMGVVELRDEDVLMVHVNRVTAKYLGRSSPAEVEGHTARQLGVSYEFIAPWINAYRKAGVTGQPVRFELGWEDGMKRCLSATVSPTAEGRFCFLASDITEIREAAIALAASEERLKYALDIANEGFWDWHIPLNQVFLSAKCLDQLSYPPSDVGTRESWVNLLHPDDRPLANAAIDEHLAGRTPGYSLECRAVHRDGHYVWIHARGQVVERTSDGNPLRMIGTQLVITERKRVEEELRQAREAALAASAAKSAFVANISHEIRTPLTAILGYADLLQDPATLSPEDHQRFADTIRRSGRHLLRLINDILDFSKIEADKISIETLACDPAVISAEASVLVRARAEAKGLAFSVRQILPFPRTIHTDPTRTRQILMNLLDNAIKFTERGAVELTLRYDPGDPATPSSPEDPGRFCFDVTDTGIGIPPESIPRLFNPFEQEDASTTRRFGGTGLGLSISHRLARLLGGGIDVASTPGKGSRFTFWLPAVPPSAPVQPARAPASNADAPASAASSPEAGARILLVEDSPDIQTLVRHVFERRGALVEVAGDGAEALALVRDANPRNFDLILMDIQMPVMDGFAATRLLRAAGITSPIIALTADSDEARREEIRAAGCDDVFAKPIDIAELLATVRRHLARSPASGAIPGPSTKPPEPSSDWPPEAPDLPI